MYSQSAVVFEETITILPGDSLVLSCTYDTYGRDGIMYAGEGTQNEMCLSFLWVYPEPDVEYHFIHCFPCFSLFFCFVYLLTSHCLLKQVSQCVGSLNSNQIKVWSNEAYDNGYLMMDNVTLKDLINAEWNDIWSFGDIEPSEWEGYNVTWNQSKSDGEAFYNKLWNDTHPIYKTRWAYCATENDSVIGYSENITWASEIEPVIYYNETTTCITSEPTYFPTNEPSDDPTSAPTNIPSVDPTQFPSNNPTLLPSAAPTRDTTVGPTPPPSVQPTENVIVAENVTSPISTEDSGDDSSEIDAHEDDDAAMQIDTMIIVGGAVGLLVIIVILAVAIFAIRNKKLTESAAVHEQHISADIEDGAQTTTGP